MRTSGALGMVQGLPQVDSLPELREMRLHIAEDVLVPLA